ncbi:MAG TPA: hypothetical protein VMJ92_01825 [Candidatus Limnocylindrales bacterium]|nr:hypothetical protein [Candidatus Limnocylindrales bacterium]
MLGRLLRRRRAAAGAYEVRFEHETQRLASRFLGAVADGDLARMWEGLSRETRGLLEGRYAARAGVALERAAGVAAADDARLDEVVGPLQGAVLAALGGPERLGGIGVSAARLVDRDTAFVLLLPDIGEGRIVAEADWRPEHLLAFVRESREWCVDLGRTAELSAEAELGSPLGTLR